MKRSIVLLCFLSFINAFPQEPVEKDIHTVVNEVSVFFEGAQITRKVNVDLEKGVALLKFVNLSPFIDARSVRVKAGGNVTVLSVNHQQNYLDQLEKPKELASLQEKLNKIEDQIRLESTHFEILNEELTFLRENRVIGGRNQELNVNTLKEASEFYGEKVRSLKLEQIKLEKRLDDLNMQKKEVENQIKNLSSANVYPSGEILVKAESTGRSTASFEVSYIVGNAGWFPSYDIRAINVNEPIRLVYKANVRQDTKVDWSNVKLRFSSSDPNVSGMAPALKTYYLDYNIPPPHYMQINRVSGRITDEKRESLPGAVISVDGTTIRTVTDYDGNYSITVPSGVSGLTYSFVGYKRKTLPVTSEVMNVVLEPDMVGLDEVVVMGYGTQRRRTLTGAVESVSMDEEALMSGVPFTRVEQQTTVDFEISIPYTVKSDNKSYSVDMAEYELPAFYQYYSVPKISREAYLTAGITDWEKYSLLEGEANVFFEDTYVGKTLLDVRHASDTLQISLGRDKNISVNREKTEDYSSRNFIGNRREEVRNWRTTVRNNKGQAVNMVILDQVPVSTNSEIDVNILNRSGAEHNPETGDIRWEFLLGPQETRDFELRYSVRFPRNRNLIVE